jgi:hypothetical protein
MTNETLKKMQVSKVAEMQKSREINHPIMMTNYSLDVGLGAESVL